MDPQDEFFSWYRICQVLCANLVDGIPLPYLILVFHSVSTFPLQLSFSPVSTGLPRIASVVGYTDLTLVGARAKWHWCPSTQLANLDINVDENSCPRQAIAFLLELVPPPHPPSAALTPSHRVR
jgi:hypothetical protein